MIAANVKTKKSNFMAQLFQKEDLKLPKIGELAQGTIIARKRSSVYVDLGPFGTGLIFGKEFYNASDTLKKLSTGDQISGKIVGIDEEEGYIELSIKEAGDEILWTRLKTMKESKEPVIVTVQGANKGGLLAKVDGLTAFLPASQLSFSHYPHVEGGDKDLILRELQKLVGKQLKVQILDIDPREQKFIVSEKALETEMLQKLLANVKVGDIVEGEVSGLVDFGVFVKIHLGSADESEPSDQNPESSTVEGLIHISELDWSLVGKPSDVVKVGDLVRTKIIDISAEGRLSLSLKALKENPWDDMEKTYKKGDVLLGTVVKFNPYGAFIKVNPAIQGLVHISEFGTQKKMLETLEIDKEYAFKILLIDKVQHRVSLGLIRAEEPASETPTETQTAQTNEVIQEKTES